MGYDNIVAKRTDRKGSVRIKRDVRMWRRTRKALNKRLRDEGTLKGSKRKTRVSE